MVGSISSHEHASIASHTTYRTSTVLVSESLDYTSTSTRTVPVLPIPQCLITALAPVRTSTGSYRILYLYCTSTVQVQYKYVLSTGTILVLQFQISGPQYRNLPYTSTVLVLSTVLGTGPQYTYRYGLYSTGTGVLYSYLPV